MRAAGPLAHLARRAFSNRNLKPARMGLVTEFCTYPHSTLCHVTGDGRAHDRASQGSACQPRGGPVTVPNAGAASAQARA